MISADYPIEALALLLDEGCLSERYAPLIAYKDALLSSLPRWGCRVKSDAEKLPDAALAEIGLSDAQMIRLFRRFLAMYEPKAQKFREIDTLSVSPEERAAFRELYHLPGVKAIRAALYYRSGYRTLRDFAEAGVEEVLARTALTISREQLACIVPLPKEVRTQIAVARAFTMT